MTDAAALYTAKTPPGLFAARVPSPFAASASAEAEPLGVPATNPAISGGLLRPGSIDQTTFLQMLQQQQQNRTAAGVGGKAVPMPMQGFQATGAAPAVPTLTSAQFAALVGAQNGDQGLAAAPVEPLAADPRAMAAAQAQLQSQTLLQAQLAGSRAAAPQGPALKLSGLTQRSPSAGTSPAGPVDADAPTISRKSAGQPEPQQMAAMAAPDSADDVPTITRKGAPVLEAAATTAAQSSPARKADAAAAKEDPDVIHLKAPPDKEQIKEFRMRNKRWVVDETPGARQLFFGPDGAFGWDDFLDLINPLQHIPGIAQIYRAVTGDEAHGAATLVGAIPFGPLGGLGLVASVEELAVKDTTGKDMGGNLIAMVFGDDETPNAGTAAPADMAQAGESGRATVETASRQTGFAMSEASARHSDCRA
jgi:hypothetical protein